MNEGQGEMAEQTSDDSPKRIVTHLRCPYTLRPLDELDEKSVEHIFPDAIGGVKDYCVNVCRKANSELGTRIDAPLINSVIVALLRLKHGIKSRAGVPQLRTRGRLEGSDVEVDVVIPMEGAVEFRVRKKVVMDDDGRSGQLVVSPEEMDDFLNQLVRNHERKGRTVAITGKIQSDSQQVVVPLSLDMLALNRAMAKIGYLAAYRYLGDAFLDDPLIPEWHKAFLSQDPEDARQAKLAGIAFDADKILRLIIPPIQEHEHAAVIAKLSGFGPVVGVSLFGLGFHSLLAIGSETSDYGLQIGDGLIAICDTKTRKTRFISVMDQLQEVAKGSLPDDPAVGE